MSKCNNYNPDNVFKRFKVIEFPPSFVGLSTKQILDVDVDLRKSAYLKTMCEGRLMEFDEARHISASHRAFNIEPRSDSTVEVTFQPKNECVSRAKRKMQIDNRFVFDLRLIQVDEIRCCENELHAEIGRYYISGQYEYCQVSHYPKVLNFGHVVINSKVTKYIRIRNESSLIAAKMWVERVTCFEVSPMKFTIPPNSSVKLTISVKPTCLKVARTFYFKIRNPHDELFESNSENASDLDDVSNVIDYVITNKINISYDKIPKVIVVESLHKLTEQEPRYTYVNEEVGIQKERREKAKNYIEVCKMANAKKIIKEKFTTGRDHCCTKILNNIRKLDAQFCRQTIIKITPYDLFNVLFFPYSLDFGKVAVSTYGESGLKIKNNTKYDISIKMIDGTGVLYTENKLAEVVIRLKSSEETTLAIFCKGFKLGVCEGTIHYIIDDIYRGKHSYSMDVSNPLLMVQEKCLKFGMVTSECFVTSVPVRIFNDFNITVDFSWEEGSPEAPFEILPTSGSIESHSCKICIVTYVSKSTKSKNHEVSLISKSITTQCIPMELSIATRKLSIKFLQQSVIFKDIPLNLETIEKVKLENSSREIALFHVVEPLIPGVKIEPMSGIIRPKMIMTFDIIIKISCVLEFAFDIFIRINNKENVVLPISGNVVEPKIVIHPKNIYMARIPCYMVTYVPITIQNFGPVKSEVDVLDTGDDNIFDVYVAIGNEKQRVFKFYVEAGQSKIVFIKVCDIFRREYEMYIPFKINGLLGPPNNNSWSTELHYYIGEFEKCYENNVKVKLKTVNKDISYCRITGVITVPWIAFSVEKFELDFVQHGRNAINFEMINISKYSLFVTIITSKLAPSFSLELLSDPEENGSLTVTENNIKFELEQEQQAEFCLTFHPKGHGKFVTTAVLYLDKHMTIPYYNLTFVGRRETPLMTPSEYRIIFPPCYVGTEITRIITIDMEEESDLDSFNCYFKEDASLIVELVDVQIIEKNEMLHTIVTVELKVCTQAPYIGNVIVHFNHDCGSVCDVEVHFCVTYCLITLHANHLVEPEDNPYPYFPLRSQVNLYDYLTQCSKFLEKWMFQQGFRRDLYPVIPDTFHALSSTLSTQSGTKTKGINVSYLNFVRRIAGPLMKHVRKISVHGVDESFKFVKEIHDTYREVINLLKSRGANLWVLQAKYLLSYEQFVTYSENVAPKCNADIVLTQQLTSDVELFKRLNKQSWLDFILQSYKVFVMDSCFFECVCVSTQPRDIIKVLIDWFNEQILIQHHKLIKKKKPVKLITNITTDLSDGIAIASALTNYCPFLMEHFSLFCEVQDKSIEGDIINNACLIIEAMNLLKLYFPLSTKDFFQPNYLQMLFLSIHLYVVLPMFKTKDTIKFQPPLLRSSSRLIAICPTSQESLIFSFMILNNHRNNFVVEKAPSQDNGKKMFLSVKYTANFVSEESCILLVHGYNKTRIFDTYIVFMLRGHVGVLNPVRKCKVTGPLYRPNRVDILLSSPFLTTAIFQIQITDAEPSIPVYFEETPKSRFYLRRLNLIDKEITLNGAPKEQQEITDHKLYLQMICLSTQVGNSWIWFTSDIGQFFVRVTTQPRWDIPIDSLQAKVQSWPMDPCSCGEACECYRTTVLLIPHRNELMVKAMRYALLEHASGAMMQIFDQLIETTTGKIILTMLFEEGGTTMSDVNHILRSSNSFRISSRALTPRIERVTLSHHSNAMLALPVTVPAHDKFEKYSITFTSDCGMDIRTYRIFFIESSGNLTSETML
ncbi:uncharacterized protein LOC124646308 [Helicoverpa zea]|uniref:uncharacterized protein LOC124646308 n=1 Tax=Helicoverpa zea TaxID=7113 RepID=UPI001F591576|nr:uncharacterized protein LOC124646308 [Helicoverpa zea]